MMDDDATTTAMTSTSTDTAINDNNGNVDDNGAAAAATFKNRRKQSSSNKKQQLAKKYSSQPMKNFLLGLPSAQSRVNYIQKIRLFFDHCGILPESQSLDERAEAYVKLSNENDPSWTKDKVNNFIEHYKERVQEGGFSPNSLDDYFRIVKSFHVNNDDIIPASKNIRWKRISDGLPDANYIANDRAPTKEEIRKLLEYPDKNGRQKPLILILCSCGMRVEDVPTLKWGHVRPITRAEFLEWKREEEIEHNRHSEIVITKEHQEEVIAARLRVDAGGVSENHTFITPEAYFAIKDHIDFRREREEPINDDSPLIRNLISTTNLTYRVKTGMIKKPKVLKQGGVEKITQKAYHYAGLHTGLPEGKTRYDVKTHHGFRKFCYSALEAARVHPHNINKIIDHEQGLQRNYDRRIQWSILEDYLRAVPRLTIAQNENNEAYYQKTILLEKQVQEQDEKSKEQSHFVLTKLIEKEKESEDTKKKLEEVKAEMTILQANTAKLLEVVMGQKDELKLYGWYREDGPIETAKIIEAEKEKNRRKN